MSKVKIEKGVKVRIAGPFTGKLWSRNKNGPYLGFAEQSEIDEVFVVAHVCGPYIGLKARRIRCTVDVREVNLQITQ